MMIAALLRCKITIRDKYARAGRKRIFYIYSTEKRCSSWRILDENNEVSQKISRKMDIT